MAAQFFLRIIEVHSTEIAEPYYFFKFVKHCIIISKEIVPCRECVAGIQTDANPAFVFYTIDDIFQMPELIS